MQLYRGIKLPGTDEKVDGMVFLENPYCPMGHFNTDWTTGGQVYYYMNLDPSPAVRVEEDQNIMRSLIDGVAYKFGRNRNKMRGGVF